jgi:hypothetical protein
MLAENGTFISTETAFCRLTKMRATDLVLDAIDGAEPALLRGGTAPSGRAPDAASLPAA